MQIEELQSLTASQIGELQGLMKQLAPDREVSAERLQKTVVSSGTHFFVLMEEEHIIGCVSLCVFESPTGRKASVEDVVVSESYRGQKLGKRLMEHIIGYAKKELAPIELHLTSNPKRVSANALYKSVGFVQRETNVYRMIID